MLGETGWRRKLTDPGLRWRQLPVPWWEDMPARLTLGKNLTRPACLPAYKNGGPTTHLQNSFEMLAGPVSLSPPATVGQPFRFLKFWRKRFLLHCADFSRARLLFSFKWIIQFTPWGSCECFPNSWASKPYFLFSSMLCERLLYSECN